MGHHGTMESGAQFGAGLKPLAKTSKRCDAALSFLCTRDRDVIRMLRVASRMTMEFEHMFPYFRGLPMDSWDLDGILKFGCCL